MSRLRTLLLALGVSLPLAGCYYDPGYVRGGAGGDAYYGTQTTTTVVEPGYYDPGLDYGYGYGAPCCYSTIGVGTVWYHDHDRYDRYDHGYRDWHGGPPPGGWRDRRPPPGGWHNGWQYGDHRPGGWQGGDHRPPPGGWHGGDGGAGHAWHGSPNGNAPHRSPPAGGWHHDH